MLASAAPAASPMPDKAKTFLQARQLTEIGSLELVFIKGQLHFNDNNRKMISQWAEKIVKYNIPVYIHSSASPPSGIRNMSEDIARHEAIRLAFNRALIAKTLLESNGISENRLMVNIRDPAPEKRKNQFPDILIITHHQTQ